jgi:hypothetical protein
MLLLLVQIVYWLALATWFGGVLFVAISVPVIFNTVRENHPVLPTVLSVNLENQHATLLAGSIVGNLIERLTWIELACAAALLPAMVGQWALVPPMPGDLVPAVRAALYLAAVAVIIYHWRFVWPRIIAQRTQYVEHADEPEVANAAKDEFDRLQRESVTLLTIVLGCLLGMVLFSASMPTRPLKPAGERFTFPAAK